MAERPRMLPVDDEMKRWCAGIEEELATWPGVTTRPMFGFVSYYRSGVIFAAIPRTRALGSSSAILLKHAGTSRRVASAHPPGQSWQPFELHSAGDVTKALEHLSRAYEQALRVSRTRPRKR